jgi:predicted DNA-binding protein
MKKFDPTKSEAFLSMRIPMELRMQLEVIAKAEDRTVASVVRRALEAQLLAEKGILDAS